MAALAIGFPDKTAVEAIEILLAEHVIAQGRRLSQEEIALVTMALRLKARLDCEAAANVEASCVTEQLEHQASEAEEFAAAIEGAGGVAFINVEAFRGGLEGRHDGTHHLRGQPGYYAASMPGPSLHAAEHQRPRPGSRDLESECDIEALGGRWLAEVVAERT